jgi:hypothetical protein
MRRGKSWFKAEAKWNVAIPYGLLAAGLLALLITLVLRWLRADG